MDGGGESVLRSTLRAKSLVAHEQSGRTGNYYVFNDKNIALCANEQPNFLNQDFCKLSYESNTCTKQDGKDGGTYGSLMLDVQLVIMFDAETLAAMHNATRTTSSDVEPHYIYAVSGLRYDDTNTDGIIIDLPCSPGNPTSRWIPRIGLTKEACTNTLQKDSVNTLQFALESSNDENAFVRDIVLWNSIEGDGCDPIDETAYGMMIMTSEGCFENVHPDHM